MKRVSPKTVDETERKWKWFPSRQLMILRESESDLHQDSWWYWEKMKVVSVKQVDDTGKHGLTLINRLSTLFNQKCDNRNNLEIHYTGAFALQSWKHTFEWVAGERADGKAWSRSICLASNTLIICHAATTHFVIKTINAVKHFLNKIHLSIWVKNGNIPKFKWQWCD